MELKRVLSQLARLAVTLAITRIAIFAQDSSPCPRFPVGSLITAPEDLFGRDGILRVQLSYQTTTDANGNTLYCFVNSDCAQSPTLHVSPGDRLIITLTNNLPVTIPSSAMPVPRNDDGLDPDDEPPGLSWRHPHVHGISEAAVQGGASGALIVEGIKNYSCGCGICRSNC